MKSVTGWFVLAAAVLGLAVGSAGQAEAGEVLYASLDNGTIERFDLATGQDLGPFASGLSRPQGLAFDRAGNLYVANGGDGTVLKITSAGDKSMFGSGFNVPTGLAFDSGGNLYVANFSVDDFNRSTVISKVTADGTVSQFASVGFVDGRFTGFYGPNGLAFDGSGNLFTSVSRFDNILKVAPNGTVTTLVPGPNVGLLSWPTGLAFDKSGNLYTVNSTSNPFVAKITPGGSVSNFYQASGLPDGLPNFQSGLVYDQQSGDLFAGDFRNSRSIDRITPDGIISTFASGLQDTPQFLAILNSPAVPEPSSVALALTGATLVALLLFWRRIFSRLCQKKNHRTLDRRSLQNLPPRGPANPKFGGISMVFPVHNESFIIEHTLRNYIAEFQGRVADFEVIVAEDGSTDDTKIVLERLEGELPIKLFTSNERKGYQQAVLDAIRHATMPWVFIVDSDYQFAVIDFWRLEPYRESHDIILGYKCPRKDPFYRIWLSAGFNFLLRQFFGVPYRDMDTGFRLIRKEALDLLVPEVHQLDTFTAEFVVRAHYAGYQILEVPVKHYARKIGSTTIYFISSLFSLCLKQFIGIIKMKLEFMELPRDGSIPAVRPENYALKIDNTSISSPP